MEIKDLNAYIHNYITNDRTHTAIMLTAPWGQGKSYYINNHLKEYLSHKNCDCVIISLYNLHDVSEISRNIYVQLRTIKIGKIKNTESEMKSTSKAVVKLIGKTVLNGLTSKIGFDFANLSDEDLQQVYESIDLSRKLIILEDLERSGITIIDVLGYVNALTEQDGVKVLIVANEDEILKKKTVIEKDKEGKDVLKSQLDEKSLHYLMVKEKTISDTIQFECGFHESIGQIIDSFENPKLKKFANSSDIQNILEIMSLCKCYNLRSFIFACQKTVDIFNSMSGEISEDFHRTIFFGIIFLSFGIKSGKSIRWNGNNEYSFDLSCAEYPLFKFCFDYVMYHQLDKEKIASAEKALIKIRLYDKRKSQHDKDYTTICNYHEHYETEIGCAIRSITNKLRNINIISFYDYGSLAYHLISIKHNIGIDVSETTQLLIDNLHGKGNELTIEDICRPSFNSDETVIQREYKELVSEMKKSLNSNRTVIQGFDYKVEQADFLHDYVINNRDKISSDCFFLKEVDISKLIEMYVKCSPKQKNTLRSAFLAVYRHNTSMFCYSSDENSMRELLRNLENRKNDDNDKGQLFQFKLFIDNLTEMLGNII